ncbi:hypothetical protein [Curtobacterium sp. VKM Ac-2852]|uniref:hypothetical protein n=1 Tax=Curtobacterium sp. VKM Ac-2852 TaxID=2739024 RepID=UPI0015655727|nr:hypothetical protein [Curtobacterium sp. VKM Ac-2852]NQX23207.1 hypothetical protein [Curtobacterium sp. VKM Ac-2852]
MTTYDRIAYRNGTSAPATVTVEMDLTNPDRQAHSTVTVSLLGVEHSATADDAFEALSLVRAALDRDGWLLGVQGARVDVWPSGMARQQGGGLRAYRHRRGRRPRLDDLVDVFAPADGRLGTVEAQRAFVGVKPLVARPEAVDDTETIATSTTLAPSPSIDGRPSLIDRLLGRAQPASWSAPQRWTAVRATLGDALTPAEWAEAEVLAGTVLTGRRQPSTHRITRAVGWDDEDTRWADLIDVAFEPNGTIGIRVFHRRYVERPGAPFEVVHDTRVDDQPPTEFRPSGLETSTRQDQVAALWQHLRRLALIPDEALSVMFWPDHGRVPTGSDADQGRTVTFSGLADGSVWSVLVSAVGHLRITRTLPSVTS